jgi:hypothetical protein
MATTSTQTAPAKEGEDNTASASHNPVVEEGALQKRIQSDIQRYVHLIAHDFKQLRPKRYIKPMRLRFP